MIGGEAHISTGRWSQSRISVLSLFNELLHAVIKLLQRRASSLFLMQTSM